MSAAEIKVLVKGGRASHEMTEADIKEILNKEVVARWIVMENIRRHIQKTTAKKERIAADKLAQAFKYC